MPPLQSYIWHDLIVVGEYFKKYSGQYSEKYSEYHFNNQDMQTGLISRAIFAILINFFVLYFNFIGTNILTKSKQRNRVMDD